jgi:Flp pilus assembly protein TadD
MTADAIVCPNCGAKVKASRPRCPRCRAVLQATPAQAFTFPPVAAKIAVALLAIVATTVLVSWLRSGEGEPVARTNPADPLSARRPKGSERSTAAGPIEGSVIPPDPDFRFPSQLSLGEDTDGDAAALERARAAVGRNPQDAEAFYEIGRALLRLGRTDEALGPLRQAMEMQPGDWRPAFMLGYASARAQRWPEAVATFRRVKSIQPNDATVSYAVALALQKLSDYGGAVQEYQNALQLDSSLAPARLGLAISLDRLGRAAEAVAAYKQALPQVPPGPDTDRIQARIDHLGGH